MRGRLIPVAVAVAGVLTSLALAGSAWAAVGPLYDVKAVWSDTNLPPGGRGEFSIAVRNVGDAYGSSALTVEDELPEGATVTHVDWIIGNTDRAGEWCSGTGRLVRCTLPGSELRSYLQPPGREHGGFNAQPTGYLSPVEVEVSIAPTAEGTGTNTAIVLGGSATIPGGSPCAQTQTELASLPPCAEQVEGTPFDPMPAPAGILSGSFSADVFSAAYPFGVPVRQAGAHPFEQRVNFDLNLRTAEDPVHHVLISRPHGTLRTVEVTLPRGLVGNPEAMPKCEPAKFVEQGATEDSTACPPDTQVGYIDIHTLKEGTAFDALLSRVPIYSLLPPKGSLIDYAFNAGGFVQAHIFATLDPTRNYAIKAVSANISSLVPVRGAEVTLWGVPADPAHDPFRYYAEPTPATRINQAGEEEHFKAVTGAPFTAPIRPFFTNPMDCGFDNGGHSIRADFYEHPGEFTPVTEWPEPLNVTGCEDPRFRFEPDISLEPTDRHAGAPTGLEVKLKVPQRNDEVKNAQELYANNGNVKAIATPPIKKTVVTLPEGMTLNPSAGQGLGGCSLEQLGMSPAGVPNAEPVRCPEGSAIGTLILHSPDLPITEPLTGRVYIARQDENPFGSLFALYLVLENAERGVLVKLAGKIELDPVTGQIKTTFDDLPQFPVSDFQLIFKGGIRAALVNPSTCGPKTITAEYFSWQDPNTPHVAHDSYTITERPDGAPCLNSLNERPYAPQLSTGTVNPAGGAFSPFVMHLSRSDEDQEISTLSLTLPNGLSAKLAGVAECPEASIAQAQNPGRTGAEEQSNPSCPASSQIGTVLVGTGTGSSLTWVPGNVYFAGPYEGAPFSIVVITPSVVGPYDLGTVVVRSALFIDPHTAQATVKTDPLPQILKGIPVRIRDVRVTIDRPQFMFNPTDCAELHVTGRSGSSDGASASLSDRFQAANCAGLAFKPRFTVSTSSHHSRSKGASLDVNLSYPKGALGNDANIRSVKVSLPKQLPSRLETLQKACLDSVFDANPAACPAPSRVGVATATTPSLPVPLSGPAYFVSHGGARFPELIIVLQGDGVTVDLNGETFISKAGITSSTFRTVPDVPVEHFQLTLPQGSDSALSANGNLCASALRMPTVFTAQNGAVIHQNTSIAVTGCKPQITVLRHEVKGAKATIVVRVPSAGRLTAGGSGVSSASKRLGKAGTAKLTLTLSKRERQLLARHPGRRLKVRIRLVFAPVHGKRIVTGVTVLVG